MTSKISPISKLSPIVIRVLGCNPGPMTLQGTNTYVLGNGRRRILLDAGEPGIPEYITNLKTVLNNENITLDHIIITHWHRDHIGGVNDILKAISLPNCKVWKYRRTDDREPETDVSLNFVDNGQEFKTEGATLRIEHTPGHTTDHISLLLKEENAIFSGDCILGEGTTIFEDLSDYMKSLEMLLQLNPFVIYPGHGPVINNAKERISHYIRHRNKRESDIHEILSKDISKSWSEAEIVEILYRNLSENLKAAAVVNVNHHLVKLEKEKKVIESSGNWIAIGNQKL